MSEESQGRIAGGHAAERALDKASFDVILPAEHPGSHSARHGGAKQLGPRGISRRLRDRRPRH